MKKIIENKIVLVTGGATGIGLNVVDNLLNHGAKIALIIDINEEFGINAVEAMTIKYGSDKAVFFKCDVTLDLNKTFEIISNKYKSIDILINNAGVINEKSIKIAINVNLISLMEWSVKFYDFMRKDRGGFGGTIINVASIYGLEIAPFLPIYHASKFGVVGFTKSLGHEYNFKKTGVRVVVLCPGFTYTTLTENIATRDDDMLADFIKESESHEWQDVDAVGKAVIDIVEKADSGTVWVVKGSHSAIMV